MITNSQIVWRASLTAIPTNSRFVVVTNTRGKNECVDQRVNLLFLISIGLFIFVVFDNTIFVVLKFPRQSVRQTIE